jgi:hypothetical protein
MSDIYGSHLANAVLVLENDRGFCDAMEEYTAKITPAFYRLKRISDRRNKDLVVSFSQNSGFMSYSVQEFYNVTVSDLVCKHLRANGLEQPTNNDCGILNGHFIQHYAKEIMIGNTFMSSRTYSMLNARKVGTSKVKISRDHDVSVYQVNKAFDNFPVSAYDRLLEVLSGTPYHIVMKEALNAVDPLTAQELREKKNK